MALCQLPLQFAAVAGYELASQPSGMVVPEADPVEVQKALLASATGRTCRGILILPVCVRVRMRRNRTVSSGRV